MPNDLCPVFGSKANESSLTERFVMEVDSFERGGDTATHELDALEVLRDYGVPDDVLGRVQEGLMLKSDHTRKTQELSRERERLLQERAYFQGMATAGAKGNQQEDSPFEQFLSDMVKNSDDPASKDVADQLRKLNAAQRAEFQRELDARTAPQTQYLARIEAKETLDAWCEQSLVKQYGKEVMALMAPSVRNYIIEEMVAGRTVDPQAVLKRAEPDKMFELELKARTSKNQQNTSRHLEGMTPQRTSQPMGGRGSGNPPTVKARSNQFDDADLGTSILQKMGITK